jgi:transposase
MMIRIRLGEAEAQRLERCFRAATGAKLRVRLNVVRLPRKGHRPKEIAGQLAMSTRSVQRWLNASLERGSDSLAARKAPGPTRKIPPALAD